MFKLENPIDLAMREAAAVWRQGRVAAAQLAARAIGDDVGAFTDRLVGMFMRQMLKTRMAAVTAPFAIPEYDLDLDELVDYLAGWPDAERDTDE